MNDTEQKREAGEWYARRDYHNYAEVEDVVERNKPNGTIEHLAKVCEYCEAFENPAEHVAACVNACAGINPGAVPKLLEACKALVADAHNKVDDMCRPCHSDWGEDGHQPDCPVPSAIAAIAEAETTT